jgi:hypothetical protein
MCMKLATGSVLGFVLLEFACGVIPEQVPRDDARLKPLFDAMARVDRRSMGFTDIARDAHISVEWPTPRFDRALRLGPKAYDVMLHVSGKTSRTVAFRRTVDGYEWIGEQERFEGPRTYDFEDGSFREAITINYDRVPISGFPTDTVAILYSGEEPELVWPRQLTLEQIQPWLQKWGYER